MSFKEIKYDSPKEVEFLPHGGLSSEYEFLRDESLPNPTNRKLIQLAAVVLIGFNIWVWSIILSSHQSGYAAAYFLDVGQGDSQLVTLSSPNGKSKINILIDAGGNRQILNVLDVALGKTNNKYIDILVITHPHFDHYGGFIDVVKNYNVGLIIYNGQTAEAQAWQTLMSEIEAREITTLILQAGDSIRYGANKLTVISPNQDLLSVGDPDEASLVMMLSVPYLNSESKVLFTGDIGLPAEDILLSKDYHFSADILKVGHHGSNNSSGENFISAIRPLVSVIGVGQNRYGHPAPRVLEILNLAGSKIFRTDQDGSVKIVLDKHFSSSYQSNFSQNIFLTASAIIFGHYQSDSLKTLSLPEIKSAPRDDFSLVPYQSCSFYDLSTPLQKNPPVIINEVAWMGSTGGATQEWIELKNISGQSVNISGWQLLNENERIKITFPQQSIFNQEDLILLARQSAIDALNIDGDLVFTGAIRNSNEGLRLFDNNCDLIDEVLTSPSWPAGNNQTKQTMARTDNLYWVNSLYPGGTPGLNNDQNLSATLPAATPDKQEIFSEISGCLDGQININTASQKNLTAIRHIGTSRANDIIKNRPFSSLLDMQGKVSGIGEQRIQDIIMESKACVD